MGSQVSEIASKAFVNPGIAPPEASYQITKPFVSKLVRYQCRSVMFNGHDCF